MSFAAKKSLGQHFLLNPSTIDKILDLASVTFEDHVLEIGPGPGVMTGRLAERTQTLIAIEKDRRFAELLRKKFESQPHVEILEQDFLKWDFRELMKKNSRWKIVANLPYNVATEILFRLLEHRNRFVSMHLMFQEEVAQRLAAGPGSKHYGVLSILTQIDADIRIVYRLPPGAFTPPPKVRSAVVELIPLAQPRFTLKDPFLFRKIVKAAFGQRRKMMVNALRDQVPELPVETIRTTLESAGLPVTARAEQAPIEVFARLSGLVRSPAPTLDSPGGSG